MPTELDKALDRARKLLALAASSTSESEAKTAALAAAKLIAAHGLLVVTPAGAAQEASDAFWSAFVAQQNDPPPPPKPVTKNGSGGKIAPRQIRAKFGGTCRVCDMRFEAGDAIWWFKVDGESRSAHYECYEPDERAAG